MSIDISTLGIRVDSNEVATASQRLDQLPASAGRAERSASSLSTSFDRMAGYIKAAAAALAAWKLSEYIKDATMLAARVETLSVVMRVVGNNAGYTGAQMEGYTAQLKRMGITTQESMASLIKMAGAQMDLNKAAQLARVAQDAAVIGGINSSEAFGRLIAGIRSGETEILKGIGINVQFEQGFKRTAETLGKTADQLTSAEKTASRMNQVLEFGTNISGAYEASMGTAGKQMLSMARYIEEIKLATGEIFLPAFSVAVLGVADAFKSANHFIDQNRAALKTMAVDLANPMGIFTDFKNLIVGTGQAVQVLGNALLSSPGMITVVGVAAYSAVGGVTALAGAFTALTAAIAASVASNPAGWLAAAGYATYLAAKSAVKSLDSIAYTYTGLNITGEAFYQAEIQRAGEADKRWEDFKKKAIWMYKEGGIKTPVALQDPEVKRMEAAAAAAESQRKAEEKARKEEEARKAQEQAEIQARYNQQVIDAETDLAQLRVDKSRQADESILRNSTLALNLRKEQGIITTQQYVDERYALEMAALEKELAAAKAIESQRYVDYQKVSRDPGADRLLQIKAEASYQKAVGETAKIQAKIDEGISQKPLDDFRALAEEVARLNGELQTYYNAQVQIENQRRGITQQNSATEASLLGVNPNGQFDSVTAETANQQAMQKVAHEARMQQIDDERQSVLNSLMAQQIAYEDYIATVQGLDKKAALERKQNSITVTAINEKGLRSQLAVTAEYASTAAGLFTALANTQDESSRSGFEAAKALNLGAAIVSTAAAIMNQMSGGDPYTAWARAAAAGAMGAIQIATILKTRFGGGAQAPSVSGGSFSASGSGPGNSGVGSKIGAQIVSPLQTGTEESLQRLADASDNASLALGKVADGLTSVADIFKSGYGANVTKSLAGNGFNTTKDGLGGFTSSVKAELGTLFTNPIKKFSESLFSPYQLKNLLAPASAVKNALFGGSWQTTGTGISLGINNGDLASQSYVDRKKSGGLFSGSKSKTEYSALDSGLEGVLNSYISQIKNTISLSATVLGTSTDFSDAVIKATKIQTSGRTPEDIQKDLETFFTTAANELAKTTDGLKEFTFYGENAFDALVRLSTSLQGVNEKLELTGHTLIESSLKGADAAYRLADAFGGIEGMSNAVDGYFKAMFTDAEQKAMEAAQATRQVTTVFAQMGLSVPQTRSEFKDLVNSLDLATDSGAGLYVALMNIAPAFGTMADAANELQKASVEFALSAAKTIQDILNSNLSLRSPESDYFSKRDAFQSAVASGSTDNLDAISKAFLEASRTYNASSVAYNTDYEQVMGYLSKVAGMTDSNPTLTAANKQVDLLQQILDVLSGDATGNLTALTSQAGLPSFAVGTSYVRSNMTANIHQGEMIIDRQSADVLRNYGIQQVMVADSYSSDMAGEIQAMAAEIRSLKEEMVELQRQAVDKLSSLETKARLVKAA